MDINGEVTSQSSPTMVQWTGIARLLLLQTTTATHYAVDPLLGFTGKCSCFLVGAVVVETAADAIGWQATTHTPTGTLGDVVVLICRRHCRGPRLH